MSVLVVDDDASVRARLRAVLSAHDGIAVIAEATDARGAVEAARRRHPDVILMDLRMPLMGGVAGRGMADLVDLVRVVAGERAESRPDPRLSALSPREVDVLVRVGHGDTNAEVAAALHLSPATTRTYVSRIIAKIGARDRPELIVIAHRSGLVPAIGSPGPGDRPAARR